MSVTGDYFTVGYRSSGVAAAAPQFFIGSDVRSPEFVFVAARPVIDILIFKIKVTKR
jgi:hypothetical protein